MSIFIMVIYANPIPTPTLILEEEKIAIDLKMRDDVLYVRVEGKYPFKNVGYGTITMYFPIPKETLNGTVKVLGKWRAS